MLAGLSTFTKIWLTLPVFPVRSCSVRIGTTRCASLPPSTTPETRQRWFRISVDLVAHVQLVLPRVVFVDDDVVGALERAAFKILEAAAHPVEAVQIDAGDEA